MRPSVSFTHRCRTPIHSPRPSSARGPAAAAVQAAAADPAEAWPAWSQPTGAHDAYGAGDRVSHNGKHWTSDADGNVWEPGVYGWTENADG